MHFKYALVGCGVFGEHHIMALTKMDNVTIVALCDKHLESAQTLKEKYNLTEAACFDDYNKMLDGLDADIVTIATADQAHRGATVAALNKNFNVLCEKPMALLMDDCKAMLDAEKNSKGKLMVGQVCRFTPSFVKAKELVEEGVIGDLYFVESEYAHDYSKIPGVDNWRMDPDRQPVIGGACHAIDLLRWIAGDPIETTAYSSHKMLQDWPIPDTTISIMKFPNGVVGKVLASIGCKRDYTMRTCLYGTKGTIIVDNTSPYFTLYVDHTEDGVELPAELKDEQSFTYPHRIPIEVNNHNLHHEQMEMQAIVRDGKEILTTGREGAKTVAVCSAVVKSAATGKPVEIDYNF